MRLNTQLRLKNKINIIPWPFWSWDICNYKKKEDYQRMKKVLLIICALLVLSGCAYEEQNDTESAIVADEISESGTEEKDLSKTDSLELKYATQFSVDYYEKGYIHIKVADGTDYVIVPENENENNLGLSNPVYIHKPCNSIYLAASSAMDLFLELNALDNIAFCSTKAEDYAMAEVRNAIMSDKIKYVGKYSAPDYESLLSGRCNLAIESTMISHSPKIKEQLERIDIPVFVERSSYEESPMGRLEWIKLYGILTGNETEAIELFDTEQEKIAEITESGNSTGSMEERKSVAFFSITSNGYVTVRKPGDYICRMIEMAGGDYALKDLLVDEENALSTINIGMEDFYLEANDADILIYNGSIDGGIDSIKELLDKMELLKDFKAVKQGNVWSTSLNMFQESSKIVNVIEEMADVIADSGETEHKYLMHLE